MEYRRRMPKYKLDKAKSMRMMPTPAEAALWQLVKGKQVCNVRIRRQAPMYGFIADFYCPSAKVVIEADGGYHLDNAAYDEHRDKIFESHGIVTLRFINEDILTNVNKVMDSITQTLALRLAA